MTEFPAEPALQVVKGNPDSDEIAAWLAVLQGRAVSPKSAKEVDNGWSAYWRAVRAPLRPGPGGWRASGRQA
jgi:hypothetical protein